MNTTREDRAMQMTDKAMWMDELAPGHLLTNNRRLPRTELQGSPPLKAQAEQETDKEWPER